MRSRTVFLSILSVLAMGYPCPYTETTFTASYCTSANAVLCVVDGLCIEKQAWTEVQLYLPNATIKTSARALEEIPDVATVQFIGNALKRVGDLSFSAKNGLISNVITLSISGSPGLQIDNMTLPRSIEQLVLANNDITTLSSTIAWPPFMTAFSLKNNSIAKLQSYDFRSAQLLNFDKNPISSIDRVRLSRNLSTFLCTDCTLTEFTLDIGSYAAIAAAKSVVIGSTNLRKACPGTIESFRDSTYKTIFVCVVPNSLDSPFAPALSTGAIVGIIVGAIPLLLLLGYCCYRIQLKQTKSRDGYVKGDNLEQVQDANTSKDSSHSNIDLTELLMYRLDDAKLCKLHALSSGAYGEVFLATYMGEYVAVKTMLTHRTTNQDVARMIAEIKIMIKLESPYIVRFIGANWRRLIDMECVLEYMNLGDLRHVLASRTRDEFPWSQKLEIALAIAEGLVYLHSLDLIHRDLKSRNVLLDTIKHVKLTDFGISRELSNETMTAGVGTNRWMAPEVLHDGHYTFAADIYSFGIILSELDTHCIPYSDQRNEKGNPLVETAILSRVIHGQIKPTFDATCPQRIMDLAHECLELDSALRPNAIAIATLLRQLCKAII